MIIPATPGVQDLSAVLSAFRIGRPGERTRGDRS